MLDTIQRDELQAGIEAGTLVVIDALPESYYSQQHLPHAVNLTADDVEDRVGHLLPDKDAAIVTYCSNPACRNSTEVAVKLQHLGYRNVRKYAEGIQDWTEAGLPTETGAPAVR
jgi:rhodanese-related sulfurtransferase